MAVFEIEYLGRFGRDNSERSSAARFGNLVVQPVTISNMQFFAVGAFGL